MADLPWKAAVVKVGDYLLISKEEVAQIVTIPDVRPPVVWATIRESVHPRRIGETVIISPFAIVEGTPQPGQAQLLVKGLAQVPIKKPIEQKDLSMLSPIDYVLYIESDGKITPEMRRLAGVYEDMSDKRLLALLKERELSLSGITYSSDGPPENYDKAKGLYLKVQRPMVIGSLAYNEWLKTAPKEKTLEEKRKEISEHPKREEVVVEPKKEEERVKKPEVKAEVPKVEPKREVEAIVSTPQQPENIIIKLEPERLTKSGYKYAAYREDGTPLYMADESLEKLKYRVSMSMKVKEFILAEAKPEPTVHYGPPETASEQMKGLWIKVLGEIRRQYPLGEPVLENEARRLGVTPKEMQLIIADERYRRQGGK
jgi:hypothetical protein